MPTKFRQSGFTLIEALVSVAIFAVVVSMASVLFLATSNAQRKATNQEKVMREVRQTMESISRLVRMSAVDYERYDAEGVEISGGPSVLYLMDNNVSVSFSLDENRIVYERSGDSGFMTGGDIDVTNLQFFIGPADPAANTTWPTQVTVLLTTEREGERGSADILKTQTTIVTRQYE